MAPERRLPGQSSPTLQERRRQSSRDKALNAAAAVALRGNARLRSIPRGPPKKKAELFAQGALKSLQFAPRGHGYYDAFVMKPETACVNATTGPATVVTGYSTETIAGRKSVDGTINVPTYQSDGTSVMLAKPYSGNATLIAFNPGSSGNIVGKIYHIEYTNPATASTPGSGALLVDVKDITVAQFDELGPTYSSHNLHGDDVDAGVASIDNKPDGRVESIPLRGSLRIRNVTENLSVGGVVRCMRYNGGIHFGDYNTEFAYNRPEPHKFDKVCSMIRDSPRTKVINGHEMRSMHQSNVYPADFVRSMSFRNDASFEETLEFPGYCTLFVLIDDFYASTNLSNNSYEVNINVQRAARFGFGSLLHGMARQLPTIPPDLQGRHHEAEADKPAMTTAVVYPPTVPSFPSSSDVNKLIGRTYYSKL